MPLVLGIAFGARATTVELRDSDDGALLGRHRSRSPEGGADDPTGWWTTVTDAVAGAMAAAGQRRADAVAVAGSHPGLVLLDAAGAVLRPLPRWEVVDTGPDVQRLQRALGTERWVQVLGGPPSPGSMAARLAWRYRTDPSAAGRLDAALLPHDWITHRLSGLMVTDRGSASLTGLWSPRKEDWVDEVLAAILPRRSSGRRPRPRLPDVREPAEPAGWLHAGAAELVSHTGRPLVAAGTAEVMAVALALGLRPGRAGVALGSGITTMVGTARPIADPNGTVRSRADAAGGHLAVSVAGGGAALAEVIARLLGVPVATLGAMAARATTGDRPVLVPGRGPSDAAIVALGASAGRDEVAAATLDGIACAALALIDAAHRIGARVGDAPLVLVAPPGSVEGHAAHLAGLAGRPVRVPALASPAATGACVQAAAALTGEQPTAVVDAWGLDGGTVVDPPSRADRSERRAAFAAEARRLGDPG